MLFDFKVEWPVKDATDTVVSGLPNVNAGTIVSALGTPTDNYGYGSAFDGDVVIGMVVYGTAAPAVFNNSVSGNYTAIPRPRFPHPPHFS